MAADAAQASEDVLSETLGLYEDTIVQETGGSQLGEEEGYDVVAAQKGAEQPDLSDLRGVTSGAVDAGTMVADNELENLAELVPDIKARRPTGDTGGVFDQDNRDARKSVVSAEDSTEARRMSIMEELAPHKPRVSPESRGAGGSPNVRSFGTEDYQAADEASSTSGNEVGFDEYPDSGDETSGERVPKEFLSSSNSLSTATQTHEVRMPMYLQTFKPATGCTNASDFIVRCFIARLRSGITVVKHGRSRWCKSRLRVLHIHADGRSLSWKPAEGEPNSSKRPPKLDLSTCLEVRHAWSPDPQNSLYTGTPILRQKCEAANAHKSFALIFKQRTVDITAVTADQCKVLMEGFSALCFRLQVATLAGRGGSRGQAMPEEDGVSTTASNTLTNTSTPRAR